MRDRPLKVFQRPYIKKKVKDILLPWRSQIIFTFQDALFSDKFAVPIVLAPHNYMRFDRFGWSLLPICGYRWFFCNQTYIRDSPACAVRSKVIWGFQAGRLTLALNLSRDKSGRLASCDRVYPATRTIPYQPAYNRRASRYLSGGIPTVGEKLLRVIWALILPDTP